MKGAVTTVRGDLLDAQEPCIAHQCNCVTTKAGHFAGMLFHQFPYANSYKRRTKDPATHSRPGTIEIFSKKGYPDIVNMYSQRYPGKGMYENDTPQQRLTWFKRGLSALGEEGVERVAFPYHIGCGAAGGNWEDYFELLLEFAQTYDVAVMIYKL